MTTIAARHPVINIDDHFLITNGFVEPESFTSPLWMPNTKILDPCALRLAWDRREYIIEPGETMQVPFDALRLKFGDPRSVVGLDHRFAADDGRNGIIPKREAEVIRLSIAWGLYQQGMHLLPGFPPIKHAKVTTIALTDQPPMEIFTPAIDPQGRMALYGHPEVEPNRADFLSIMESMENRMARQTREIEILRKAQETGVQPVTLEEEEPETVPKDIPRFA